MATSVLASREAWSGLDTHARRGREGVFLAATMIPPGIEPPLELR